MSEVASYGPVENLNKDKIFIKYKACIFFSLVGILLIFYLYFVDTVPVGPKDISFSSKPMQKVFVNIQIKIQ